MKPFKTIGIYIFQQPEKINRYKFLKDCGYNYIEFCENSFGWKPETHPAYFKVLNDEIEKIHALGMKVGIIILSGMKQWKGPGDYGYLGAFSPTAPSAQFSINLWAIAEWDGFPSPFTLEFWQKQVTLSKIAAEQTKYLWPDTGIIFSLDNYYRSLTLMRYFEQDIEPGLDPNRVIDDFSGLVADKKTKQILVQVIRYIENHSSWQVGLPPTG
jgi:hypothetical protein